MAHALCSQYVIQWSLVDDHAALAEVLASLRSPLVAAHLQADDVLALGQLLLCELTLVGLRLFGAEPRNRDVVAQTL